MERLPVRLDDLIEYVRRQHPTGDALERLTDAVLVGEYLGDLADHLIGHFVDQARRSGASWTDIGQSMGVSKQAVQKRFVTRRSDQDERIPASAFARFTDRARNVVTQAQAEARDAGSAEVGTEHLLLGILHEPDGLAGRAIAALGVSAEAIRAGVRAAAGPTPAETTASDATMARSTTDGPDPAGTLRRPVRRHDAPAEPGSTASDDPARQPDHLPFSPGAKRVRDRTFAEALRLGHNYVGTEHILLGLLAAPTEPGARILIGLSVTRDRAEEWIVDTLRDLSRSASSGR
ncbi:Clp protease N-terminal domain-containing protein [Plantactinospora sp. KLBMP9567]|uniref:Clp protease N-terminal domain-containing protein n=1 Tax=Plantactinospora sp. KLBMP9567 TaxID=3085900 RepID=UPI00298216EB|nr:Clp protease N-terminal domain-containing protein [Plantactinospora sp. KLBMP9567]MDW5322755.1 Clp protease N-terminal domain-containing protein [Plantactinospora sp. KLBMP9567]